MMRIPGKRFSRTLWALCGVIFLFTPHVLADVDYSTLYKFKELPVSKLGKVTTGIAFSADSKLVAFAEQDFLNIWEADSGTRSQRLEGSDQFVQVAFAPQGDSFATGGGETDQKVRLWKQQSNEPVAVIPCSGPVLDLAYSANGQMLAVSVSGEERGVVLIDTRTGKEIKRLAGMRWDVIDMRFRHEDKKLETVGGGLWEKKDERQWTTGAEFMRWDTATGAIELQVPVPNAGPDIVFSHDGAFVAFVGTGATQKVAKTTFSNKGTTQTLTIGNKRDDFRWGHSNVGTWKPPSTNEESGKVLSASLSSSSAGQILNRGLPSMAVSPDNRLIVLATSELPSVWDGKNTYALLYANDIMDDTQLQNQGVPLFTFAFSPDGKTIAGCGAYPRNVVWKVK